MASNEVTIWTYLSGKGLTDYAVAGIMGNLYAESGLIPNNLQNLYNTTLGMTDEQYTQAVDSGRYNNFVRDMAGYGLAQWTFWSRKQDLLSMAQEAGKSVGDLGVQLDLLWQELREFGLVEKLNACKSVREASDIILKEYEKPYDTGPSVQNARAEWSQGYYNRFHGTQVQAPVQVPVSEPEPGYCVVGFMQCPDKATAQAKLSALRQAGFNGYFVTVNS